jgi:RNA polymerase sigma-70 factor (ECF subfamily)
MIEAYNETELRVDVPLKSESQKVSKADTFDNLQCYTDDELVMAAQNGISGAMSELLQRHKNLLYRTVRRFTVNAEDTEDAVQDAMLRAFVNIGRFRRESRFSSWLISIAINSVLSSKRRSRRAQWIYLDAVDDAHSQRQVSDLQDHRPTPEQKCICRERIEILHNEIQKLPSEYRSVLQARNHDDATIGESADNLGITVAAFKSRLWRARTMLAKAYTGVNRRFSIDNRMAKAVENINDDTSQARIWKYPKNYSRLGKPRASIRSIVDPIT